MDDKSLTSAFSEGWTLIVRDKVNSALGVEVYGMWSNCEFVRQNLTSISDLLGLSEGIIGSALVACIQPPDSSGGDLGCASKKSARPTMPAATAAYQEEAARMYSLTALLQDALSSSTLSPTATVAQSTPPLPSSIYVSSLLSLCGSRVAVTLVFDGSLSAHDDGPSCRYQLRIWTVHHSLASAVGLSVPPVVARSFVLDVPRTDGRIPSVATFDVALPGFPGVQIITMQHEGAAVIRPLDESFYGSNDVATYPTNGPSKATSVNRDMVASNPIVTELPDALTEASFVQNVKRNIKRYLPSIQCAACIAKLGPRLERWVGQWSTAPGSGVDMAGSLPVEWWSAAMDRDLVVGIALHGLQFRHLQSDSTLFTSRRGLQATALAAGIQSVDIAAIVRHFRPRMLAVTSALLGGSAKIFTTPKWADIFVSLPPLAENPPLPSNLNGVSRTHGEPTSAEGASSAYRTRDTIGHINEAKRAASPPALGNDVFHPQARGGVSRPEVPSARFFRGVPSATHDIVAVRSPLARGMQVPVTRSRFFPFVNVSGGQSTHTSSVRPVGTHRVVPNSSSNVGQLRSPRHWVNSFANNTIAREPSNLGAAMKRPFEPLQSAIPVISSESPKRICTVQSGVLPVLRAQIPSVRPPIPACVSSAVAQSKDLPGVAPNEE